MTETAKLPQDWKDFIGALHANDVQFIVVGAWALHVHGRPRYSGDIDFLINPTPENAARTLAAIGSFGFGSLDIKKEDLSKPNQVIQLGVAPTRIDILTSITGVTFADAWKDVTPATLDGIALNFLSAEHLIRNKRALGREKDLRDAADLEQFLEQQKQHLKVLKKEKGLER